MTMNYLVGILVVTMGVILGFFVRDINGVLQWIVSALYGGYIAANVLKWYWWRFNANGFFWGMLSGIVAALIFTRFFEGVEFLYYFPLLFAISLAGAIGGTYAAPPTDMAVLKHFYRTVHPWGFWGPVLRKVQLDEPEFRSNPHFRRDIGNVALGIVAQLCLTILPMYLVLGKTQPLIITILILAAILVILKRTWWNKLSD
jgi:solute:Na+ symporter, SSS family